MLGWERSTLTHSSAGDAVLVPVPVLVLPGPGLEAVLASSVSAVVVAWLVTAAEVDGEAVVDGEAEVEGEAELEGDADPGAWLPLTEADTDGVAPPDVAWLTDE